MKELSTPPATMREAVARDPNRLTPLESRIFKLLEDGILHHKDEIRELLIEEDGTDKAIYFAIIRLRRKIERRGLSVQSIRTRGCAYRLVRLLASNVE